MKQSWSGLRNCGKALSRLFCVAALILVAAIAVLLFAGCATAGAGGRAEQEPAEAQAASPHIEAALAAARSPLWKELLPGIWTAELPAASCGTEFAAVKIELKAVSIAASLPEGESEDGAFFAGEFAGDFAARTGAAIAVNMTPFSKKGGKLFPSGIYINSGTLVSPPDERYAAIFFFRDGGAAIAPFQDERILPLVEEAEFAFGGFWVVLEDGELVDFPNIRNSRMVLGLDSAGETLFILAAAKSSLLGSSTGISYPEGAALIKALGAENAIQMDGGSSTCLAVNGEQVVPSKKFLFVRKNKKTAVIVGFRGNSELGTEN